MSSYEEDSPVVATCNYEYAEVVRNQNCLYNNNPPLLQDQQQISLLAHAIVVSESLLQMCSESSLFQRLPVSVLHRSLGGLGVPDEHLPTALTVFRVLLVILLTLTVYYICWGKRHMRNRKALTRELTQAQQRVRDLQAKMDELDQQEIYSSRNQKEIRIFMDGAFDLLHYGHMNAFRLARSLGTHLIVGVNSDASITQCKGAPLMADEERLTMVKQCKFVDEVVEDCPYVMSPEYLEWVISKFMCKKSQKKGVYYSFFVCPLTEVFR